MKHACSMLLLPCIVAIVAAPAYSQADAPADSLDAELLDGLAPVEPLQQDAGEDLGAAENSILRLSDQMRRVGGWLHEAQLGAPTQRAQQEIIAVLDQLIAQQEKQCQGGRRQSSPPQPNEPSKSAAAPKPKQAGAQAAADSTDAMRPGDAEAASLGTAQDILKKVWGHLPARLRNQMLQNPTERFLPKYERAIEDYYERLIELDDLPEDRSTPPPGESKAARDKQRP